MIDVLIAGAGIAGSSLALFLRRAGLEVLLVDRVARDAIGPDRYDSLEKAVFGPDGIPGPEPDELAEPVSRLVVASPTGKSGKTIPEYPYYIAHRRKLEVRLARLAEQAGAQLRDSTEVLYPLCDEHRVFGAALAKPGGAVENVPARVTVDATGIDSVLRTKLPRQWDIATDPFDPSDCAGA